MIEGARLSPDAASLDSLVYKLVVRNVRIRNHWDSQSLMLLSRGPTWECDPFSAVRFNPPPLSSQIIDASSLDDDGGSTARSQIPQRAPRC